MARRQGAAARGLTMKVSQNGLRVIQYFESCHLEAYPDPGSADGHPWTIGWGATGPGIHKGVRWTQRQADERLVQDLERFEREVASLLKIQPTQGQFDALVSFAYNVGSDIDADTVAEGLGDSTLLRKFNANDMRGAVAEFRKWNKNDGKVLRGLVRRRAAEAALFDGFTGDSAIAAGRAAAP